MASDLKLDFARYEFKYVLRSALRDEVERELSHFMSFDPYVLARPGHRYFVRSLYFDDPVRSCYRDKDEGALVRARFRIRGYEPDGAPPYFLEIKGRRNDMVVKHRVPIEQPFDALAAGGDGLARRVLERAAPGAVRTRFEFELSRKQLRPGVLVDYWRRPYVSKYDPEFRLTFDHELSGTATDRLWPESSARRRQLVPGYSVLEVKFRYHLPAWFHRIIQAYELRRRSFSKVGVATEALGLV